MDLKMSKNQLQEIPDDLQMPNLKHLDLSGNQITGIPKTFGALKLKSEFKFVTNFTTLLNFYHLQR